MATALVTGATSGIGHEFVRQLAEKGDDLVLVARDVERMERIKNELEAAHGVRVEILPADLSLAEDVTRVAERLEDPTRPIDMLVNNAGFGLHVKLLDKDALETHRKAFAVMVWAVLELSAAAGRAMSARGHGSIINVASTSAWILSGNYSPIKAWVLRYTESLANEMAGSGVQVTALCPGWVHTEFHERAGMGTTKLPDLVWVDVDDLVREALADNARGRIVSIPTWKWKTATTFATHVPRGFIRWFSRKLTSSRSKGGK